MSGNESSFSHRERSPSLMRSNNDQGRWSKEVSPKVGEPLKEHPKRKRPKFAVNLWTIEALMKKDVPHRRSNQKSRRNDIDLEARKTKRKSIGDIYLRHHHEAHQMTILMRVNIEILGARKAQIIDLGWFLMRISTNTSYLQIWPNTPTLILILLSKRQT